MADGPEMSAYLRTKPYPGRGLICARLLDGSLGVVYFLTGRSEASRRRGLQAAENGDISVVDTAHGPHDDLRHYTALARRGDWFVAGNGDQVLPIVEGLKRGREPVDVWSDHTYEPDPPIHTPRIWAVWNRQEPHRILLGDARRSVRPSGACDRTLTVIDLAEPGDGVVVTTYSGTVEEVIAAPDPISVYVEAVSLESLADEVWNSLDPSLRVALIAVDPSDPTADTHERR